MKASPNDITAVAIDVLAYDLVDMAPFNFQRRSMRDYEVMEIATMVMMHPSTKREEEHRQRALVAAHYIMERLEGLGWENTLRTDTNTLRDGTYLSPVGRNPPKHIGGQG